MNSVENTNMSNISMSELIAIGEYFSGNIPDNDEQFESDVGKFLENPLFEREVPEKEPIIIRPKPRRIPSNYTGKRGTAPQWKYSKRQQEKAALIEEAFKRLKSDDIPGLPETMGGVWRTDNVLINREVEKIKEERNPKVPKKRGRPPKAKTDEVKVPKKRGRPPKVKTDNEVKVPKKRGRPPRRQTVAERFIAQKTVRPVIPADSAVTKVGPGKYNIAVDFSKKRPVRKAPEVPKGVAPWRPTPKPRTVLPKERPVPAPRTKKPVSPPKIRKPVKVSREVREQSTVVTPEEHEIDPFGTDLEKPFHRKIETAANGAAVTYSITPHYMDPLDQLTASRQVV